MTTKTKNVKGESSTPASVKSNNDVAKAAKIAEPIAKEAEKVLKEAKVIPMVSVQDRFDRLEQFQALERRHVSIKGKSQQLKVLRKANDSTGAEISIQANSEKITLNNAAIVEEVLELLDAKLEALHEKTEREVLEFVI